MTIYVELGTDIGNPKAASLVPSLCIYLFIGYTGLPLLLMGFLQLWCKDLLLQSTVCEGSLDFIVLVHRAQFSCGLWDLPELEIKPGSPALATWILSHWATRGVPVPLYCCYRRAQRVPLLAHCLFHQPSHQGQKWTNYGVYMQSIIQTPKTKV